MSLYRYGVSILLPALPESDAAFLYKYIAENAVMKGYYALFISDKPFVYDTANNVIVPTDGATVKRSSCSGDTWSEFVDHSATELLVAEWCNETILDTEGNEFLVGTEPVLYVPPIIITHDVTVDLMHMDVPEIIHAVQEDQYSRNIRFTIKNDGEDFEIPEGTAVEVAVSKPDGSGCYYEALPDGTPAGTIEGNTVTIKLAPQALTAAGKAWVSAVLNNGSSYIHTFRVLISVQPKPGLVAMSGNYFKIAGCIPDYGWEPNMYLRTNYEGKVVAVPGSGVGGGSGATFFPSVSADGVLSWTNDAGMDNPEPVNIKGPQGDPGPAGADGPAGYTPVKGEDYFTDEDKTEMVNAVLEALPAAEDYAF